MLPPELVTLMAVLELSPLFKTRVPPAKTRFAATPMFTKLNDVPGAMTVVPGATFKVTGVPLARTTVDEFVWSPVGIAAPSDWVIVSKANSEASAPTYRINH